jgi:clan AA aspartic protease
VQIVEKPETTGETMGEVRTVVTLTNATDQVLVRRGKLAPDEVHTYRADAQVDTGAVRTVLPPHVVQQLDLAIRGRRVVELADGRKESVGLTEPVEIDIDGRNTIEDALVLGDEVIIGQTVLETLDLYVDCANKRLFPNPAHPDQPVVKIK